MKPFAAPTIHRQLAARFAALVLLGIFSSPLALAETTYTVRQSYTITNVPADAKQVRGWFWMPEDRPEQKVIEFRVVEAPETFRITRDPRYGRSWLYADAAVNPSKPLRIVTEFKVIRRAVSGMADATKTRSLSAQERRAFPAELRRDEIHMTVTPQFQKVADEICGSETNPVTQAYAIFHYVIDHSEHYSKSGPTPKGKCIGDAGECMAGTGDCCTDQHALFITLCRARGIPCRLMFGSRLLPGKEENDYDPGYRCWPNFYASGLGWVPLDVSSADAASIFMADDCFGGLDENRLEWAEGRDFDLEPRSQVRPDLVIRGWVEVDGKPYRGIQRVVNFSRQPTAATNTVSEPTIKSAAR